MNFRMLWLIFLCVSLCSCFGTDRRGGVMKYHEGTVWTGTGKFSVPVLPSPWKGPKISLKQLVYKNDPLKATIVADALCGPKYDEAPLPNLAREMFQIFGQKFKSSKIEKEKKFLLDGRAAVEMDGEGAIDGVPLKMRVAVMKKSYCLYDFVYFAAPKDFASGVGDFEGYLHGFKAH